MNQLVLLKQHLLQHYIVAYSMFTTIVNYFHVLYRHYLFKFSINARKNKLLSLCGEQVHEIELQKERLSSKQDTECKNNK